MRNKGRGGFGQPLLFPWPLVQHARPLSDCQLDLWSVLDVGIWPGLNRELRAGVKAEIVGMGSGSLSYPSRHLADDFWPAPLVTHQAQEVAESVPGSINL